MTPNNSDQAALHDELRLRIQKAIADGCNMRWQDAEKAARAAIAALSMPSSEAADPDYILPCDVRVAPATTIAKGCKLGTLLATIRNREGRDVAAIFTTPQPAPAAHAGGGADAESEHMKADKDAMIGGLGFLVDGVRIDPVRVSMLHYKETLTHPSPIPVDALRELVKKWQKRADALHSGSDFADGKAGGYETCADELTALLSGGAAREE